MIRNNRILLVLFLLTLAFSRRTAFSQVSAQMLVTTDWLATHANDPNIVVLDVSSDRRAYYSGHIPGAQFLPLQEIAKNNSGGWLKLPAVTDLKAALEQVGVGNRSRIILYGDYKGLFAARAYFTLDYLGLGRRAAILDGGLEKWRAERRPLSSDVVISHSMTLTVTPHPEVVAELPAVLRIVSSKTIPLIDARQPTEFSGSPGGVGAARTGHIPGAKDVFWADNLANTEIPVLKPVTSIQARYLAVGLKPGMKVIVYCHGGLQASYDYFTLKLAGFRPVLYAGSFAEWDAAFGTPVETGRN